MSDQKKPTAPTDAPQEVVSRSDNFSEWYYSLVRRAGLADHTLVRGCMVIKPYGYALWENIQQILDKKFKDTGHVNAYFPLFVPESLLLKEADHVEGFAPECAWVTHGGGDQLEERLAIRPTSEAIICSMYSKWVQSYRDLPILINQWANVVRWESRTRLFLRTTEFLWQEGHTVHRTHDEAEAETVQMINVYRDFLEKSLAIPVIPGEKTANERFAGALRTYTVEAMMGDGKALQAGTSHNLGQHFAKAFDIKFLDEDNTEKHAWQTSWGVSTRLIGGLIMVHGDESGLIFPPAVAPYQAVFTPIFRKQNKDEVLGKVRALRDQLREDFRLFIDETDNSPGWKFNEWEMRGVPVRIEVGPRDLEAGQAVLVRRDTKEKLTVSIENLGAALRETLASIQQNLYNRAFEFRKNNTSVVTDWATFQSTMEGEGKGFILAPWDGSSETEKKIKEATKATIRCLPFAYPDGFDSSVQGVKDVFSGQPAERWVYFAQSY